MYWASKAPKRYKDLGIEVTRRPPELRLPRFTLGKLYASRTGHGDFAAYHERLGHSDADTLCQCGWDKALDHFYYCRLGRRAGGHVGEGLRLKGVLAAPKRAHSFDKWLTKTGYFRTVCAPHGAVRPRGHSRTP